jgi:hypothetical protein
VRPCRRCCIINSGWEMRFCIASAALGPGPGGGSPSVPHLAPAWHRSLAILVYFCVLQMSNTRSSQVATVWVVGSGQRAVGVLGALAYPWLGMPRSCPCRALVVPLSSGPGRCRRRAARLPWRTAPRFDGGAESGRKASGKPPAPP